MGAIRKAYNGHLANTFVHLYITFHLTNLVDGQLQYSAFAIFGRALLQRCIESSLRLRRRLLDLHENLAIQVTVLSFKHADKDIEPRPCVRYRPKEKPLCLKDGSDNL